jgi:hypothetical protein
VRFRKLRIAWTAFCGIACVLLVVLWVRSYWRSEFIQRRTLTGSTTIGTNAGHVYLTKRYRPNSNGGWTSGANEPTQSDSKFIWVTLGGATRITVPCWFTVLVPIILAGSPWIPFKRFSLRTLLIATTLVAVVLGAIVYAVR